MEASLLTAFDSVLEEYAALKKRQLHIYSLLIADAQKVYWRSVRKNEQKSCAFNLFDFFEPGETTHSAILATLLNPSALHGQGNLFLKTFLKQVGIEQPDDPKWVVTAEKGRIDILLRRQNPHSVVIIENKSNNAIDQENQLYRYWYRAIYLPNRKEPAYLEEAFYRRAEISSRYKIIYLPPKDTKQPNENSIKKPSSLLHNTQLPDRVPLPVEYWNFQEHIVQWLMASYRLLPVHNYRMKEFIRQYTELWK